MSNFTPFNEFVQLELLEENDVQSANGLFIPKQNKSICQYRVLSLPKMKEDSLMEITVGDIIYCDKTFVYSLDTSTGVIQVANLANLFGKENK